nr:biotin--[acetyl-CoA-carboxylase] ligase [bacterium]
GSLYMSVLLRPESDDPATLSLVSGIAVLRALRKRCREVALKWPNDIVVPLSDGELAHGPGESIAPKATFPYRKICGILAESRDGAICVGLGVNVRRPQETFATNMAQPAYLEDLVESCPDPTEIGREVLAELADAYELWKTEGFAPFAIECNDSDVLIGSHVAAQNPDGQIVAEGTAVRIADDGSMVLQSPDGSLSSIRSGEVHLIH